MGSSVTEKDTPPGSNAPQPITTLRGWLDHLAAHDRLAVIRPETSLKFELAAIAKRFDGYKATLFPRPGGHAMPIISGLVSDRQWIAEAMGVESSEVLTRFSLPQIVIPAAAAKRRKAGIYSAQPAASKSLKSPLRGSPG